MRIYLAGAVELVSSDTARTWRRTAKGLMREFTDLIPVDPLDWESEDEVASDSEIVNTDRHLLANSDVVLVDGRNPSWGTGFECAWAFDAKKPLVIWGVDERECPTFLRHHATLIVKQLPDAILEAASLGMPDV